MLADLPQIAGDLQDPSVGDFLAVPDFHEAEFRFDLGRHVRGGDHQRAEIIAFAGLIDPDAILVSSGSCSGHGRAAL